LGKGELEGKFQTKKTVEEKKRRDARPVVGPLKTGSAFRGPALSGLIWLKKDFSSSRLMAASEQKKPIGKIWEIPKNEGYKNKNSSSASRMHA